MHCYIPVFPSSSVAVGEQQNSGMQREGDGTATLPARGGVDRGKVLFVMRG